MKLALALIAAVAVAQQTAPRGKAVFARTCGAGYCHATDGIGGGAPRLNARGFELDYIRTTVADGVPGTQMAAFGATLPKRDLDAVVTYVASLNGIATSGAAVSAPKRAPVGAAARGQALFSDATRGFGRCATCHLVNGIGVAVAAPIQRVPVSAAALKSLATPSIATATWMGETMPALVVARKSQSVTFYDLTSPPPVLRTVEPAAIQIAEGSSWRHAAVTASYTDAEVGAILAYLAAVR